MSEYQKYRSTEIIRMRDYVAGEDMTDIRIDPDLNMEMLYGGMIAKKGEDCWYISMEDFEDYFEEADD